MGSNARRRRTLVRVLLSIAVLIGALFGFSWYEFNYRLSEKEAIVRFEEGSSLSPPFRVEIVATPQARQKGLMYRKMLPEGTGMIFVFPKEEEQSFWMKDTYVSLDIIFVAENRKTVGILENVPVLNESPRTVSAHSKYVVELPGGTAARYGIRVGSTMNVERGVLPGGE